MYTVYNSYEGPTVLGIPERWERVLSYSLGWLSGIVLLIVEQRNKNVRRHAAQSVVVFGALNIAIWVVGALATAFSHIWVLGPILGFGFWVLSGLIWVITVILWLVLMLMAYSRPAFVLPFGRTYERLLG